MHVRDATVGPLSGTVAVSATLTSTLIVGNAQRVGDDLRVHRPRALTDFGAGDPNLHAALGQGQGGLRGQLHLAAAGEAGTVEEQ